MGWKDTIKETKEDPRGSEKSSWRDTIVEKDPGFGPTKDGSLRSPLAVDWMAALGNEFTKETPGAMVVPSHLLSGPLGGLFGGVARSAVGGAALQKAPGIVKELAKDAAAGYIGSKVEQAFGGSGASGGFVGALGRRLISRGLK